MLADEEQKEQIIQICICVKECLLRMLSFFAPYWQQMNKKWVGKSCHVLDERLEQNNDLLFTSHPVHPFNHSPPLQHWVCFLFRCQIITNKKRLFMITSKCLNIYEPNEITDYRHFYSLFRFFLSYFLISPDADALISIRFVIWFPISINIHARMALLCTFFFLFLHIVN